MTPEQLEEVLEKYWQKQQLYISQRLESHFTRTSELVDKRAKEVLDASATAHNDILERLERIESKLDS